MNNMLEEVKSLEKELEALYANPLDKDLKKKVESIKDRLSVLNSLRDLSFFKKTLEDDLKVSK